MLDAFLSGILQDAHPTDELLTITLHDAPGCKLVMAGQHIGQYRDLVLQCPFTCRKNASNRVTGIIYSHAATFQAKHRRAF